MLGEREDNDVKPINKIIICQIIKEALKRELFILYFKKMGSVRHKNALGKTGAVATGELLGAKSPQKYLCRNDDGS